jgi:predicted nucleic acid-binding protein
MALGVSPTMNINSVLLDTSFFIRLLNKKDPLHKNVLGFYRHFLEGDTRLKLSTVSIAVYCVRGQLDELPILNLEVIPLNVNHAVAAGTFANIVFENRNSIDLPNRLIIPNDSKLFAQAHLEVDVTHFATSDVECQKVYDLLKTKVNLDFELINIRQSYSSVLGVLPFED